MPKAYRPVALLNTLGKLLEAIVARQILYLAEQHNLLPKTQKGAQPGRSTLTALELLVEQIRAVWSTHQRLVATLLSLDISGAFDNVSHKRLIHNLRNTGIPDWIGRCVSSFLQGRTTILTLGEYKSSTMAVTTGILQGSILSPILFLFFSSTLLPELNRHRTTATGFVDDTNILTFIQSTEANCRTLEKTHRTCATWEKTHGVTFAQEKYQPIQFIRKPKRFNMKATIQIPGFSGGPSPMIRRLGIHLDPRLIWGPHIRLTAAKATTQMAAVTRLAKSTWGASFTRARQIYAAIVRPAMAYGSPIWFDAEDVREGRNKAIYPLQVVQNRCLRAIAGAYRSTNVAELEHETSIKPLDICLERMS